MLGADDVAEIDAALGHLHRLGDLDFLRITSATFPLGRLGKFLIGLRDELRFGRGFVVLRGISRERYSTDAASPETYLDMNIGAGDIQVLNNRLLLHGRTGYVDHYEMARRRHLLRLWLRVPGWPELPANQGMHRSDDHAGWLRQRTPFMEVPSRYLAEITRRQAGLVH